MSLSCDSSHRRREETLFQEISSGDDATIVFTGPRGNGKSSLAIIAGFILKRQVIDANDHFLASAGLSKTAYKREHGRDKFRSQEMELTRAMLMRYERGCVIACGPSLAAEAFRDFIIEYKKHHPVIYVTRPVADIEAYLGFKGKGEMEHWMQKIHFIYRQISNLEYFNLPEQWKINYVCSAQQNLRHVLPHRRIQQEENKALQRTQTDLARFLAAVLGQSSPPLSGNEFPTMFPSLPEQRLYTSALRISLRDLAIGIMDLSKVESGADLVELVIDGNSPDCRALLSTDTVGHFVAEIRRFLAVPIMLHVDTTNSEDTGWSSYFAALYRGLRLAPEYLTINLQAPDSDIERLNYSRGCTVLVGHAFHSKATKNYWQSPEPMRQYERARQLRCGLVRLSKPCEMIADNFSCLSFIESINATPDRIPIIAFNSGKAGHLSAACNSILTTIHPSPSQQISAPLQDEREKECENGGTGIDLYQRLNTLFTLHVLDALKFYVVGSAVKCSVSPAMHNAAFKTIGMPHTYSIHETDSLEELRSRFEESTFGGASISLPFKQEVLSLTSELSPSASIIGAANTILPVRNFSSVQIDLHPRSKHQRNRAGTIKMLYGDNSDWMGIFSCVARSISPANTVSHQTAALVVGAGGMARAAVFTLLSLGVRRICIFNRTFSHAQALVEYYERAFVKFKRIKHTAGHGEREYQSRLEMAALETTGSAWPENFNHPSIIICAIKAHHPDSPDSSTFKIPLQWLRSSTGGVVVELAFHSPETPLMRQMRQERHPGWTIIDPVEVLYEQACAQFELFTGNRAPRGAMWNACLNDYAKQMTNHAYKTA